MFRVQARLDGARKHGSMLYVLTCINLSVSTESNSSTEHISIFIVHIIEPSDVSVFGSYFACGPPILGYVLFSKQLVQIAFDDCQDSTSLVFLLVF
jgi:hypothetical protein